jgi:serine/threonine protein kinase
MSGTATLRKGRGALSEEFPLYLAGFRPGSVVAGYRLEAQLGVGGMAVVFRARDERLARLVALKIMAPALAADGAVRRRFIAESRAAAAVDDPHIIPIYEAGEASGVLFIAMRFVAGGDLRRVLEREGPLPPGRAAAFTSQVASALDAAHGAGLVHRDVKPAKMLIDARPGRPRRDGDRPGPGRVRGGRRGWRGTCRGRGRRGRGSNQDAAPRRRLVHRAAA